MTTEVFRFEIARLELQDGDTLVVKHDQVLSKEQSTYIRNMVEPCVPEGVKVLVLTGGLGLEVLRKVIADA